MFHGIIFKLLCLMCVLGVLTGTLLVDGAFIEFRGEEIRRIIRNLGHS